MVRVPAERVHAAVGSDRPEVVATALRAWLEGPVIRDLRSPLGPYYVFIAPGAVWDGAEERLGAGAYLGVPCLLRAPRSTGWVVRPRAPRNVCDPVHLHTLLALANPLRAVGRR
ncbi:hypothetical protein RB200_17290 [Streptomyces sp. PmtG]